jgi:hypothetical protein
MNVTSTIWCGNFYNTAIAIVVNLGSQVVFDESLHGARGSTGVNA